MSKYQDSYYEQKIENPTKLTSDQLNAQVKDMKSRSITPDTHKARVMIKDQKELMSFNFKPLDKKEEAQEELQINIDSLDFQYYVDEYQYNKKSAVLHFGINPYLIKIREKLIAHNQEQSKKFSILSAQSEALSSGSKAQSLQEKQDVKSKSIKSAPPKSTSTTKSSPAEDFSRKIDLTDIENDLMQKATDYLLQNDTIKAVLVDVFARQPEKEKKEDNPEKGQIRFLEYNPDIPETHTIVLYRNYKEEDHDEKEEVKKGDIKHDITVIDPSNPQFSSHLANFKFESSDCEIKVSYSDRTKIYKPIDNRNLGPRPDQSRDCIDISVKLAFGLNHSKYKFDFSGAVALNDSIRQNPAVQALTNQKSMDQRLEGSIENTPFRLKQSSDINHGKKITKIFSILNQQLKSINSYYDEGLGKEYKQQGEKLEIGIRQEYIKRLGVKYEPENYELGIKDFFGFHRNSEKSFHEYQNECTKLSGESLIEDSSTL